MPGLAAATVTIDNLTLAQEAVDYTKSKMTLGAFNKVGDVIDSMGASAACVATMRIGVMVKEWKNVEEKITLIAKTAESIGCGNCGEQSMVAFMYLKKRGVRPLQIMAFTNVNHGYVVIGRSGGKDNDPLTWGANAAVADPWLGKAYPAYDLGKHWPGGVPEVLYNLP